MSDDYWILKELEKYSEEYEKSKLDDQVHARAILSSLNSNKKYWPKFREDLDIRTYYMAHYQISNALILLENGQYLKEAKLFLKKAAEALEYLYRYNSCEQNIKSEVIFKSILAYYISGNYACAYVLAKEIKGKINLPFPLNLIADLLKKNFKNARLITLEILGNDKYLDKTIADELVEGKLSNDEALSRVLTHSIAKAISFFIEFVKTGKHNLFEKSISILNDSISLSKNYRLVDWWWWLYCLLFIFNEYNKNSLWTCLKPFEDNDKAKSIVKKYIQYYLAHEPPIIELWPSQVHAIPTINNKKRIDFCLKMPTSAGKTQIAELTILRYFLDNLYDNEKKCIYIAPFRSLAIEIEKTFKNSFESLGIKVSEIYGGFDLNPLEDVLINEAKILIMTPEKFDAILRYIPDIGEKIGLIILDEGHIVDSSKRGLNFEFFIQRLISRYNKKDCRFLFISAVLPNADEFAQWITGSPEQVVRCDWKPSRLMLGKLEWKGKYASLDYTHTNEGIFGQSCFVRRFIEQTDVRILQGVGKRQKPFPKNMNESLALSALLFAQEGTTLVFVPQKRQVKSFGEQLIETIKIHKAICEYHGKSFEMPLKNEIKELLHCKDVIKSEMGNDSILLKFLDNGFVIHHADLPSPVRNAIEELIRAGGINLIVATTTLAEGVNLPVKTVFIKGLQLDKDNILDPLQFWNICGRAGRGGRENEGQILFSLDMTEKEYKIKQKLKNINFVLDKLDKYNVISSLLEKLNLIVSEWKNTYPYVDLTKLCTYLANNSYSWVSTDSRSEIQYWMDVLDGHLLTLSEELDINEITPTILQKILEGSLLFIQLKNIKYLEINQDIAVNILNSRISYIRSRYPKSTVRKRLYKLGMRFSDCEKIEADKDKIYKLFDYAFIWDLLSSKEKIDILIKISEYILNLADIKENIFIPEQLPQILSSWLNGIDVNKMVKDNDIKLFTDDPTQMRLFLEQLCGYRLPWGLNSLINYLKTFNNPDNMVIPPLCSYFSGMFKYGTVNPIEICILPYINYSRDIAPYISKICPYGIENPERIINWFVNLNYNEIIDNGVDPSIAKKIVNLRDSHTLKQRKLFRNNLEIELRDIKIKKLNLGDRILVIPEPKLSKKHYKVLTLDGTKIGTFKYEQTIPKWWSELHLTNSFIADLEELEESVYKISIIIER